MAARRQREGPAVWIACLRLLEPFRQLIMLGGRRLVDPPSSRGTSQTVTSRNSADRRLAGSKPLGRAPECRLGRYLAPSIRGHEWRSKTDQHGRGRRAAIWANPREPEFCPLLACERWMAVRREAPGGLIAELPPPLPRR